MRFMSFNYYLCRNKKKQIFGKGSRDRKKYCNEHKYNKQSRTLMITKIINTSSNKIRSTQLITFFY